FARGSNPAIDLPNQRKNVSYGLAEVEAGRADWIAEGAYSQGIICRAFLYRGQQLKSAVPEIVRLKRNVLSSVELPRTQFKDSVVNSATRQLRMELVVRAEAFARMCQHPVELYA